MQSFCDWCGKGVGIPHQSSVEIHRGYCTAVNLVDSLIAWARKRKRAYHAVSGFQHFIDEDLLPKLKALKKTETLRV
jgi:hypothetical protein